MDVVFCYLCKTAFDQKKTNSRCLDSAFISRGYSNWKDALVAFKKHEESKCHRDSVQVITLIPKHYRDCGEMLSEQHASQKAENHLMLYKILTNVR